MRISKEEDIQIKEFVVPDKLALKKTKKALKYSMRALKVKYFEEISKVEQTINIGTILLKLNAFVLLLPASYELIKSIIYKIKN